MFEFFDHTADLGLRVRAADLDRLFEDAGAGLFSMIVDPLPLHVERELVLRVDGTRHDHLLFDWLNELLYLFETEHLVCGSFHVQTGAAGLQAKVGAEPLDERKHRLQHEVKAITYHGLRVERTGDEWLAEVIVDI